MSHPIRLLVTASFAALVLAGCGSAPLPLAPGARALGPMAARAEKKLDDKLFAGLEATKKASRQAHTVEIRARKKGIRVVVVAKKDRIDGVTINGADLVRKGELVLKKERSWIKETEASKQEQRKQVILKTLELLADGLVKAEVEKADAEDVKKVAAALATLVKEQSGEKKPEAVR